MAFLINTLLITILPVQCWEGCTFSTDTMVTTCTKDSIPDSTACYVQNDHYTGIMIKKHDKKNSKPYWTDPTDTFGVWHDGGSSESADWIMGKIKDVGKGRGILYSNADAKTPDQISNWYSGDEAYPATGRSVTNRIDCNTQSVFQMNSGRNMKRSIVGDDEDLRRSLRDDVDGSADVVDVCPYNVTHCDANADCEDLDDVYTCECRQGYEGDGTTCTEIDECETQSHNCDANAQCTNVQSSFECTCNEGYAGNGANCVDCSACDKNAECTENNGVAECTCATGYTGSGYRCACSMFSIDCDAENGFDVKINNVCKDERFPNAPEGSEMIVTSYDLVDNPDKIDDFDQVSHNCIFNITAGRMRFGFNDCGVVPMTAPDGADYTVYTAYVIYRAMYQSFLVNLMEEQLECRFSIVDMASNAVHMHTYRQSAYDVIDVPEDVHVAGKKMELKLSIGTVENNDFHEITENEQIPIEQEVQVKLVDSTSAFGLALKDCEVVANNNKIKLFEEACTKSHTPFRLSWISPSSFTIKLVRIANWDDVSIECDAEMYLQEQKCNVNVRERRSADHHVKRIRLSAKLRHLD